VEGYSFQSVHNPFAEKAGLTGAAIEAELPIQSCLTIVERLTGIAVFANIEIFIPQLVFYLCMCPGTESNALRRNCTGATGAFGRSGEDMDTDRSTHSARRWCVREPRRGAYSEAAAAYRKALALNPNLPGIRLNLGLAEFKQGHFRAAIPPLAAVLRSDASNMQARTLLGLSYYGARQYVQAAKHLEVAAKADPDNIELHQVLAQTCVWTKQLECALNELRLILKQNPDSAAAHILAGEALDGLDRRDQAIAEFQEATKAAPTPPNAHFGLGYLYWKSHRYDDARREFEAELAADPKHAQSLAYLGDIEIKQRNPEKAMTFLRESVAIQNNIHIAYLDIGILLMDQKQYKDAEAALSRAVEVDPEKADAHYRLARLYQATGNSSGAQKEFETVRQLNAKEEEGVASKMPGPPQ
jgi:tetratricopeptide (TPR) repeat protein